MITCADREEPDYPKDNCKHLSACTNVILTGTTCIPQVSIPHIQGYYLSSINSLFIIIIFFLHLYSFYLVLLIASQVFHLESEMIELN